MKNYTKRKEQEFTTAVQQQDFAHTNESLRKQISNGKHKAIILRIKLTIFAAYLEAYRSHVSRLMGKHYKRAGSLTSDTISPSLSRKNDKLNDICNKWLRLQSTYKDIMRMTTEHTQSLASTNN